MDKSEGPVQRFRKAILTHRRALLSIFIIGVVLAALVFFLALLEFVALLVFAIYYGLDMNDENTKDKMNLSSIPGETFFTISLVIVAGFLSFASVVYSVFAVYGKGGSGRVKYTFFIITLVINICAFTLLFVQSANFGADARALYNANKTLCTNNSNVLTTKEQNRCWGLLKSMWVIFAACIGLLFSVFYNLLYNIFVIVIRYE
jgi:hypothetical protein